MHLWAVYLHRFRRSCNVVACHCNQCCKTSSHYVSAISVDSDCLSICGEMTWFRSSDVAMRAFCGTCGSGLFWRREDSDQTSIFAGTFDGTTRLVTDKQLYPEDKGDYYDLLDV
ncbi:MAG: GFA family protein [Pseudomonadota bacterium]